MLAHYAAAAIAGTMLFFTVAVAPTIFRVLPQEWASRYVRAFFPKYYAALGLAALVGAALGPAGAMRTLLLANAAAFAVSLWGLTPAINRATDAGARRRFAWLHGASVALNVAQLASLAWGLWTLAP